MVDDPERGAVEGSGFAQSRSCRTKVQDTFRSVVKTCRDGSPWLDDKLRAFGPAWFNNVGRTVVKCDCGRVITARQIANHSNLKPKCER